MLRFEADTLAVAQGPEVGPEQHALLMAVDGTHSAGKSTVLRDYLAEKELLVDDDIDDFGRMHEHDYPVVCVSETVSGVKVPVVVVGEVARQLDAFYPDRNMLTSGYSRDSQASITLRTLFRTQGAGMSAMAMARKFQPNREKLVGAVLTDRGVLSGFSYALLRLPEEEDHGHVDLANISDLSTPSFTINIAEQAYRFAGGYDKILLTDHTEIGLEDDGKRVVDDDFRTLVADSVAAAYQARLSAEKIAHLRGDRAARVVQLSGHIRELLQHQLEA
jgi:hypothetical protein